MCIMTIEGGIKKVDFKVSEAIITPNWVDNRGVAFIVKSKWIKILNNKNIELCQRKIGFLQINNEISF